MRFVRVRYLGCQSGKRPFASNFDSSTDRGDERNPFRLYGASVHGTENGLLGLPAFKLPFHEKSHFLSGFWY